MWALRRAASSSAGVCSVYSSLPSSAPAFRAFAAAAKPAAKKKKKVWSIKKRTEATYPVGSAVRMVQAMATARFDETIEIALQLGVDPRKGNQNVRGVVQLPHGTGKSVRVAVFARGPAADAARAAGADVIGAEELVEAIQAGEINFEKAVATPDMMPLVGRVARILGPRGLMPNPKLGSVTPDVKTAVSAMKAGQVNYRVEKHGIVHAPLGKASFSPEKLEENLRAFMIALANAKPEAAKGVYLRHATLSSTQGRGVHVEIATLDPAKPKFMTPYIDKGLPPTPSTR